MPIIQREGGRDDGKASAPTPQAHSDMERPVKSTCYAATPRSSFGPGWSRRQSKRLARRLITLIFADRPLRGTPS